MSNSEHPGMNDGSPDQGSDWVAADSMVRSDGTTAWSEVSLSDILLSLLVAALLGLALWYVLYGMGPV